MPECSWEGVLRKMAQFYQISWYLTQFCRNCAFRQKFHARKLGEITAFYVVRKC